MSEQQARTPSDEEAEAKLATWERFSDEMRNKIRRGASLEAISDMNRTAPQLFEADGPAPINLPPTGTKLEDIEAALQAAPPMLLEASYGGPSLLPMLPLGIPAMLAGPPGAGKTWWAIDCAWSVAGGGPMFAAGRGARIEPAAGGGRPVLIVSLEDERQAVHYRIAAIARRVECRERKKAILANVDVVAVDDLGDGPSHLFDITRDGSVQASRLFDAVRGQCADRDYALVIIDTFAAAAMGEVETSATAATQVIRRSGQLGREGARPTVLFLHHTRKSDGRGDARAKVEAALDIEAMRGTSAILGSIRWGGMLAAAHDVTTCGTRRTHVFFRVAKVNGCAKFAHRFHMVHDEKGALRVATDEEADAWEAWDGKTHDLDASPSGGRRQSREHNEIPRSSPTTVADW